MSLANHIMSLRAVISDRRGTGTGCVEITLFSGLTAASRGGRQSMVLVFITQSPAKHYHTDSEPITTISWMGWGADRGSRIARQTVMTPYTRAWPSPGQQAAEDGGLLAVVIISHPLPWPQAPRIFVPTLTTSVLDTNPAPSQGPLVLHSLLLAHQTNQPLSLPQGLSC